MIFLFEKQYVHNQAIRFGYFSQTFKKFNSFFREKNSKFLTANLAIMQNFDEIAETRLDINNLK